MEWRDKIDSFKKIDVRGIQGNFFQGIKKQAMQLPAGNGLEIVQSFDPIPLYEVMEGLGYEHFTEQKGDAEFHAYFYRTEVKQEEKDIIDQFLKVGIIVYRSLGDSVLQYADQTIAELNGKTVIMISDAETSLASKADQALKRLKQRLFREKE